MWHKPHTWGHTRILLCVTLFSLESWGMSSLFPELGRVIKSPESTTRLSGPSWWDQLRKPCWSLPSSSEFPGGGVSLLMLWILGKIPPWSLPVHQTAHTSKHIWFHLHFLLKTLPWISVFRTKFTHLSLVFQNLSFSDLPSLLTSSLCSSQCWTITHWVLETEEFGATPCLCHTISSARIASVQPFWLTRPLPEPPHIGYHGSDWGLTLPYHLPDIS